MVAMQLRLKLIYYVRKPQNRFNGQKKLFSSVVSSVTFGGPTPLISYMKTGKTSFYSCLTLLGFLFLAAGCQKNQEPAQRISVVMKKYSIEPSVIHIKAGQPVALEVRTADVQHGFDVPELGIKEPVQPGHPATISFTPKSRGEYKIECGIICGPHHEEMTGKLVVD
jgi:heme/copper-type cytochrome/quinol oxidase subunit 2